MTQTHAQAAITANIGALAHTLDHAAGLAKEAHEAALSGKTNLAIGTLSCTESEINAIKALYDAAMVLHRMERK